MTTDEAKLLTEVPLWIMEGRAKGLAYLASPYSDPDPRVMAQRHFLVCRAAAFLLRHELMVFSPIAHTHPIALAGSLPTGWDFWAAYDKTLLNACSWMILLKLPGWERSVGVEKEYAHMIEEGKYIRHTTPEECGVILSEIP